MEKMFCKLCGAELDDKDNCQIKYGLCDNDLSKLSGLISLTKGLTGIR
jgi:hypothetical protein